MTIWLKISKRCENARDLFQLLFFNFIFKLYKIVLVLPNIKMNPPQVYMCSPSWTLLPPPSLYHLSGWSQCTSPKHPVSCIEPGLATRFIHDIIHVSMPFSQIFPPSPSPIYTSVSLLLSRTQGYCYHLSKFHILKILNVHPKLFIFCWSIFILTDNFLSFPGYKMNISKALFTSPLFFWFL